jgi:predicted SAM-dependent methyltransferase
MHCLNLGCGRRFHPQWINIDFVSTQPEVMAWDLTRGLPFEDETFDVVYHSHFLEHLSKLQAPKLLRECYRVLRPGGILRVAVPDLEQTVRAYLEALQTAIHASQTDQGVAHVNYEWMMLELYDQAVRHQPGGEAVRYLRQDRLLNADFVCQRWGTSAQLILQQQSKVLEKECDRPSRFKQLYSFLRSPRRWRESFLRLVLGQEYSTLQLGRFRQQGEVHQWMYDRYSLKVLLQDCGFTHAIQHTATTSKIPDWVSFCLDTEADGSIVHPDSLYVEAVKASSYQ